MQVFGIIASPLIAALVAIFLPILQRKWKKEDESESQDKEVLKKLGELSGKMDVVEGKVSSMATDLTKTQNDIQNLSTEFRQYKEEDEAFKIANENKLAEQIRVRILRADDDLCNKGTPYPSEGYFAQIMTDCDEYEAHVEKRQKMHSEFKNGIAEASIAHIRKVYSKVKNDKLYGESKSEE